MTQPPIEALIPHRAPIRLIERVVDHSDDAVVCEGRVPPASTLAAGPTTTPVLGVEMAAQAAAVLGALGQTTEGADAEPRIGYLASIRSARFHVPALPADQPLRASVRRTGGLAALALYEAEVTTLDGTVLVTASFGTMAG